MKEKTGGGKFMEKLREFNPAAFASVMGTGAVAIASYRYAGYLGWLREIGIGLTYLNFILYFVLLIPWLLRWVLYQKESLEDLRHPSKGHFYGTSGAATIVLSAQALVILKNQTLAWYLWLWGLVLTFIFAFWMSYEVFIAGEVDLRHLSPAWYIPPVALVIIPFGAAFMRMTMGYIQELTVIVNYLGWGAGFFLYLVLYAVVTLRFIRHELMPPQMAPLIWMNLGPIGASITALFALIENSTISIPKEPFMVFAFFLWGLGFWWLVMATAMTLHYVRNLSLPYSGSWWAFIFPLGAFVNATKDLGGTFELKLMSHFGFLLLWPLLAIWLATIIKMVSLKRSGKS
ncbi:tellurite-resistance/dicarboxylate transporter [Thermococcus sp. Bubb.Bath]|uniref:tellurite-resistance/dicarboxylate transporter n=1 Tax=Thermococcus sp. Bubb.Bath TaxID=1638242 RepID=UPI001F0E5B7C|nr:tellurite-resistance/dicarboxylate transporter [Thermococcus sp. Bubb.Bath]